MRELIVHHSKFECRLAATGQNAKNSHWAYLVRFTPVSDRRADIRNRQLRAMSGPTQCSKLHLRSNTSSARATSSGGSPPQQLGGGPVAFTIALRNYAVDKTSLVLQTL